MTSYTICKEAVTLKIDGNLLLTVNCRTLEDMLSMLIVFIYSID